MTNKIAQISNSIDQIQLKNLEYKLQQDILAQKKVLKWARTIETRIERTRSQLENLKQQKQNAVKDTIRFKTTSKIPIPSRPVQKTPLTQQEPNESNGIESMSNNRYQEPESNILVDEKKIKKNYQIIRTTRLDKTINAQQPATITINDTRLISNRLEDLINKKLETFVRIIDTLEFKINSIRLDSLDFEKDINKNSAEIKLLIEKSTNLSTSLKDINNSQSIEFEALAKLITKKRQDET